MIMRIVVKTVMLYLFLFFCQYNCIALSSSNQLFDVHTPTEWTKVPSEQHSDILNVLIKSFENNSEKIKTIQGEYNVSFNQMLDLSGLSGGLISPPKKDETQQMQSFTFRFACDNSSKNMFREKLVTDNAIIDTSIGKALELQDISPVETSSIATAGDCIFSRHKKDAYIAELTGYPETVDKKVARRVPLQVIAGNLADYIDPMEYFDLSGWGNPGIYLNAITGKSGEVEKNKAMNVFSIYQTNDSPP